MFNSPVVYPIEFAVEGCHRKDSRRQGNEHSSLLDRVACVRSTARGRDDCSVHNVVQRSRMADELSSHTIDAALEDLNMLLADLDLDVRDTQIDFSEQQGFTQSGVQPGGCQNVAFTASCNAVVEHVNTLEEALRMLRGREEQHKADMGGGNVVDVAILRGMPKLVAAPGDNGSGGSADDSTVRIEALSFMCSELQVLCMEAHQALQGRRQQNVDAQDLSAAREALASGVGGSESSDQRIRALAVLSAIQRMLAEPGQSQVPLDQTETIMSAIATRAAASPPPSLVKPRAASNDQASVSDDGDAPLLKGVRLIPDQGRIVERIHVAITADFALRRRMLLRRCDMTVQSFLRRKQGDSGEAVNMPPSLQARRQAVSDEPALITIEDALMAPRRVAWRHASKIIDGSGPTAKIPTKLAEIDEVPDRGGLVGGARAGPAMPAWTSRKEFAGGRGRGSGGRAGGKRDGGRKGGGGHRRDGDSGGARGGGRGSGRGNKRKRGGRGDRAPS